MNKEGENSISDRVKIDLDKQYANVCEAAIYDSEYYRAVNLLFHLEEESGIDAQELALEDDKVLGMFGKDNTSPDCVGIPFFHNRFLCDVMKKVNVLDFYDVCRLLGIKEGSGIWTDNAEKLLEEDICTLKELPVCIEDLEYYLKRKHVPQEARLQIIAVACSTATVSVPCATMMKECGVPEWYVEFCNKTNYLPHRNDLVHEGLLAYRVAYFKYYYPNIFYQSYMKYYISFMTEKVVNEGKDAIRKRLKDIECYEEELFWDEIAVYEVATEQEEYEEVVYRTEIRNGFLQLPLGGCFKDCNTVVVTRGMNGNLALFLSTEWETFLQKLKEVAHASEQGRKYRNFLVCGADEEDVEKQAVYLREVLLEYAGWKAEGIYKVQLMRFKNGFEIQMI